MVGWHHWLNGHGSGWTPGVGDGQGGLVCGGSWGCKESDTTEHLNWTELRNFKKSYFIFLLDTFLYFNFIFVTKSSFTHFFFFVHANYLRLLLQRLVLKVLSCLSLGGPSYSESDFEHKLFYQLKRLRLNFLGGIITNVILVKLDLLGGSWSNIIVVKKTGPSALFTELIKWP